MEPVKYILVLRSGGEYTIDHADILFENIDKNLTTAWEPILYSDMDPCSARNLKHGWPGWWSKMEIFQEEGPCVFMDLDTIITGNIDWLSDIACRRQFVMLRDVVRGTRFEGARQSSLMSWCGHLDDLYHLFTKDPAGNMKWYRGDQEFIDRSPFQSEAFQDIVPGKCASFKVDLKRKPPGEEVSVVFFHGKPRPWEQKVIPYGNHPS